MAEEAPKTDKPTDKEIYAYVINSPVEREEGEDFEHYKARRKLKNIVYKLHRGGINIDVA